jgi:hypothetical protein
MVGQLAGDLQCPTCGKTLDGYAEAGGGSAMPGDGDFTICVYCVTLNVFVAHPLLGFTLRQATVFEQAEAARQMFGDR